ncbi:alpha/beta fold hydrolase [Sphingomicrobium sp. XHP0239]|uniref:alpha/beta fold hydrolase n=1 Tax=Sphingomicrobium maritimum TaxID=3133972 RepID=UPI0031CC9507
MWTFGAGGLSPCDPLPLHEHTPPATRLRKTHPPRPRLWGGSRRSWDTISPALFQARELIILELPGHGQAPAQNDSGTFQGLARSLDDSLVKENLTGIDIVGSSLGALLVFEMARRSRAGSVVALDPGGFWQGWERERTFFQATITTSTALVRALRPALPALTRNVTGRTAFMLQLSERPWALDPAFVLN